MTHNSKTEALEVRGLYRGTTARWAEVIIPANSNKARKQAAKRRAEHIHRAARPPARQDDFGGMREAISRAHVGVGLYQPNGKAFRRYPGSKNCSQWRGRDFSRPYCVSSIATFIATISFYAAVVAVIIREKNHKRSQGRASFTFPEVDRSPAMHPGRGASEIYA